MTRYATIDEVNAAIQQLEEREHASSTDKVGIERHSDTKPLSRSSSGVISYNGQSNAKETGENGEAHEEESDSDSGSGSAVRDGQKEELDNGNHDRGSESDDGDDYDDGDGPGSEDENEFRVRQKVVKVDPEEQADFDQELKALLQESIEQRKLELRGRPALNMTIPLNIFEGGSGKDHHQFGRVVGENGEEVLDEENGERREVQVRVLVKRGNKQQTKQMLIPSDCSLVQSTKQKEAAELEEKQDIKRLVLESYERDEEEANGLGSQILNWTPGGGRGTTRTGEGKGGGSRHRFYYHQGGGGSYHTRRK